MIVPKNKLASLPISLPSGVVIATDETGNLPLQSTDGRQATGHPFCDDDVAYLRGIGVAVAESLPSDWVPVTPIYEQG